MLIRVTLSLLFFSSIFFAPWQLTVMFAVLLLLYAESYEVLIGGLLMDILYGAPSPGYLHSTLIFTIVFTLLFIGVFYLKRQLVFYNNSGGAW